MEGLQWFTMVCNRLYQNWPHLAQTHGSGPRTMGLGQMWSFVEIEVSGLAVSGLAVCRASGLYMGRS